MHCNGDEMHMMRKLGWASLLAAAVALGGCDDDNGSSDTTAGTSATMTGTGGDTDPMTTGLTEGEETSGGQESSGGGAECDDPPSHDAVIQPIWDAACVAACHEPGGSWQTTDLSPGAAYDALVDADGVQTQALADIKLVIAGDTENSYLINKLDGTQADIAGTAGGVQMPSGAPPLSADQIALVEQWIACGAQP